MTNEWLEFKAYTDNPVFSAENKQSTAFIGRFTVRMIKQNKGFNRIFTVLARGYLFHNADGTICTDDPYERTEEARRFLCAWCSLPYEAVTNKALKFHTSFPELHSEFPDIVDENGAGWYYRYLHSLSDYIKKNKEDVTKKLHCFTEKKTLKAIEVTWANKLIQYQYSIYNNRSSADFPLLFDTAIADALILGPLRTEAVVLPDETLQKIKAYGVNAKTERLMITLAEYYIANKEPDSDWVIIPRTNISAYLGSASYVDNYEKKIPEDFMDKKAEMGGVSAVRINL
ncbi:MAG: hypothetical protein U0M06_13590 [Clostridia bacterium]|nr:hypothetical protein [Clostridia bacterium]